MRLEVRKGYQTGIQFQNMHHKSTFSDLYVNEVGHEDDDSCPSNND